MGHVAGRLVGRLDATQASSCACPIPPVRVKSRRPPDRARTGVMRRRPWSIQPRWRAPGLATIGALYAFDRTLEYFGVADMTPRRALDSEVLPAVKKLFLEAIGTNAAR
jgi:hypothetical protein